MKGPWNLLIVNFGMYSLKFIFRVIVIIASVGENSSREELESTSQERRNIL